MVLSAFAISLEAFAPEAAEIFGIASNFLPQEGNGEAFGSIGVNTFESSAIFVTTTDRITGTGEVVLTSAILAAGFSCLGVVSISCSFRKSCFNFSRAMATSEILPSESCSKSLVGSSASGSNELGAVGEGAVGSGVFLCGGGGLGGVGSGTGVGGGILSSSFSFFVLAWRDGYAKYYRLSIRCCCSRSTKAKSGFISRRGRTEAE